MNRRSVALAIGTLWLAALLAAALTVSRGATLAGPSRQALVSVTVDPSQSGAAVPGTAIGMNTAVWDGALVGSKIPPLLRDMGVKLVRFPGGSTSDVYHWRTHSITETDTTGVSPRTSFDNVMQKVIKPAHVQAMITVNYGSNLKGTAGASPKEAAAWVRHANREKHDGVRYWEIGNEIYGNGFYGAKWETDLHRNHSPSAYAHNALAFIRAMKAQEHSIKVGLVLTAPGNWPDGLKPDWNHTVLSIAGRAADFVSVHWYPQEPGNESDSKLLDSVSAIPDMVSRLRAELNTCCGSHGTSMPIMVTETNSVSSDPGKQTVSVVNALFLLENYLTWLQEGVQNVSWWDLHNSPEPTNNNSPDLAGAETFGDYGVLSSSGDTEPPLNTPFPTAHALEMLAGAVKHGARFVHATSASGAVRAYALREASGTLALLLVNTNPAQSQMVQAQIAGSTQSASAGVTSFDLAAPFPKLNEVSVQNGRLTYTLQPYAAALIQIPAAT